MESCCFIFFWLTLGLTYALINVNVINGVSKSIVSICLLNDYEPLKINVMVETDAAAEVHEVLSIIF